MVMQDSIMISLIPLFPLLGFVTIGLLNKHLSKITVTAIACGSVLVSFGLSLFAFFHLLNAPGDVLHFKAFDWIIVGSFSSSFSFLVDPLSSLMLLIITGVGFLIHVYSTGYMHDDEGYNRFFAYLNLFIFFMLILVMGSNYLLMFVGWEGVGLCSYLLIGFWFKNHEYNNAARKAFVMNRIGDAGLILGIILIFVQFGSVNYADVFSKAGSLTSGDSMITLITILLFVGAIGKSAQIPLYTWLPDAMAGPTPVSALIHAATMVTAGIYMIARNNILYTLSPFTCEIVIIIGLSTAILAAIIAVMQNDIKKVLAYSTVSQLGLMFVALGVNAYATGIFHMTTHAFFKALLFLGAGSVIHALSGEQDLRNMGGLKKYLPVTWITFLTGTLAIAGIPPFSGFFSKDEILAHAFAHNPTVWGLAVLASLLTAFYMFRLFFLTFAGTVRANAEVKSHIHESPKSMAIPLMMLAVLATAGGFIGIPAILGGTHALDNFLAPVFATSKGLPGVHHLSHTTEYTLMAVIITLTLIMIFIAYQMYIRSGRIPSADEKDLSAVQRLVYNKFYVDELYDAVVTRPLNLLSAVLHRVVEILFIDRLVNATGKAVREGSRIIRYAQTGNTGFYIFIMVISVIVILISQTLIP